VPRSTVNGTANESLTVGSRNHELDRRAIKLEQFVE
jgi:hypothetical protein